jgi:ferrous iron transport protein A
MKVQVVSIQSSGSVLLAVENRHIGIGSEQARQILVSALLTLTSPDPLSHTYLREMVVGTRGYIVGYDCVRRGYQGKLLAMGLLPGTRFQILRAWKQGNKVELLVDDVVIALYQPEADALVVEEIAFQE